MAESSERPQPHRHYQIVIQPNKMDYTDGSGVRHEIHIPTGRFDEAAELYENGDWEELNKFPVWAGQHYVETGFTYFTCDEYSDETETEDEDEDEEDFKRKEDKVVERDKENKKAVNDEHVIFISDDEDGARSETETVAEDDGHGESKRSAIEVYMGDAPREYVYISD